MSRKMLFTVGQRFKGLAELRLKNIGESPRWSRDWSAGADVHMVAGRQETIQYGISALANFNESGKARVEFFAPHVFKFYLDGVIGDSHNLPLAKGGMDNLVSRYKM